MGDALSEFLTALRAWFAATPLNRYDGDTDEADNDVIADALVSQLAGVLRLDKAASKRVFADRAEDIQEQPDVLKIRLTWATEQVEEWGDVAAAQMDEDAVCPQ